MKHFLYQLRRVKIKEILQIWKLPIALICVPFYKAKHRDLWIVCEDINEARDNGYWFYKYVKKHHPEQECVYAISSKSPDLCKIKEIGDWIEFGTLKHWILYLSSSKKISSQKAGNPNAAIFYFLEVYGLLHDDRIFLQHGITKDDCKWLYYNVTKMKRFICGAYPEYQYISRNFGYPINNVVYTGFCRFDGLHDSIKNEENIVLIMPTWREWISDEDYRLKEYEGTTDISKTEYFTNWTSLINDINLQVLSSKYNCRFVFFPHRNMQKYMNLFPESKAYIEIADSHSYDVQELMKKAAVMITDYSSVFMDMVYMKKPVVFYQFDYEKFRRGQYAEGYFSYLNNPFGVSCSSKEQLLKELDRIISCKYKVSEEYLKAHSNYFTLYDSDNCKRVYDVVKQI